MKNHKRCVFCNQWLEIHHITLHERLCYLNPENLEKICWFIKTNLHNRKKLNRSKFLKYSQKHKILSSITITKRMGYESWDIALYQLSIYGYLQGFLTFEDTELLLFQLSHGSFWMDSKKYSETIKRANQKEIDSGLIDANVLMDNYQRLIAAIVIRTQIDVTYNDSEYKDGENDIYEATDFLFDFCPEVLVQDFNRLSNDVVDYLETKSFPNELDYNKLKSLLV